MLLVKHLSAVAAETAAPTERKLPLQNDVGDCVMLGVTKCD
jgi:hypothetical protein